MTGYTACESFCATLWIFNEVSTEAGYDWLAVAQQLAVIGPRV